MTLLYTLLLSLLIVTACAPENSSDRDFGFYVWHPDVLDKQVDSCREEEALSAQCALIKEYSRRYEQLEDELAQRQAQQAEHIQLHTLEGDTEQVRRLQKELKQLQELVKIKQTRAHRRN